VRIRRIETRGKKKVLHRVSRVAAEFTEKRKILIAR